ARRAVRPGGDRLSNGQLPRLRAGAHQRLLGAAPRGDAGGSARAARSRGGVARGAARGCTRALLQPLPGGGGPGTLPGRAGAQARRAGRQQAAGPVAPPRPLAGELRSLLAGAHRPAGALGGDAGDDRSLATRPTLRAGAAARRDRAGRGARLHGCRGGAPSRDDAGAAAGPARPGGPGRAGAVRAAAADAGGLRPAAAADGSGAMSAPVIEQQCKHLGLPAIAAQACRLAEVAEREGQPHLRYLEALLTAELEERAQRAIVRRLRDAHLPHLKTLDGFDFRQAPQVSAVTLARLAEGGYIERAAPVVFLGDCGTGKTHLLTALCVAACRQRRRVRFTTAAALVNELVEAQQQLQLRRVLAKWARYDVLALDEVGYVPLADAGAELLFQVVAERAERAAVL